MQIDPIVSGTLNHSIASKDEMKIQSQWPTTELDFFTWPGLSCHAEMQKQAIHTFPTDNVTEEERACSHVKITPSRSCVEWEGIER